VITTGALASYLYGLMRYGVGPRARTQAFLTLVLGQLLHAYSCRSERTTVLKPSGRPPNRYLHLAVGGTLLVQLLASLLPGLRTLLGITPIAPLDALAVAAGALVPLVVNEAAKGAGEQPEVASRSSSSTEASDR
jgi:Cation transport ATPase